MEQCLTKVKAGIGVVVHDSSGQVIAALAEKVRKPCNSEMLEMLAARRAVIFATEIGIHQPIMKALQQHTFFLPHLVI